MRRKCCVPNCDSAAKCSICQIGFSYFKTPRDPSMIKKWELALGLKSRSLQSRDRVCNSHFKKYHIVTKRFVSLKRPTTNSKMILEISKLEHSAVPTVFPCERKQCTHRRSKHKSAEFCRTESAISEPTSSQSDDTDDNSADDQQQRKQRQVTLPTRKDCRATVESVANRSKRRQIRALKNLHAKWLEKKKNLVKEIRLLEARIAEFGKAREDESFESDG